MSEAISSSRSLHRLLYSSRQKFGPGVDVDAEVEAIVLTSALNNALVGVTGLLLAHEGWFVQALEGPAQAVMTTYQRILNDPRHADSRVLSAGPAEQREFGDWDMCARRISATDDAILTTLAQRQAFDPTTLSAAAALRLLKTVAGIKQRTTRVA
ncbi:BLUF domain-containing protein [Phenylobacterium aquaticum]|uniref:BLUF domain-containing protein n=1 Tax=Phenylobacterium aquaticum TaxID=1763816 RepID=UPI0026E9C773|nr:BLUF domain-containing protein [Phenylobacterium aquaticum]